MKTALVTGGTRGIGRAISERLLSLGYRVIATGRRLASECDSRLLDRLVYCRSDVTSARDREGLIAQVREICGSPDLLVNNAGVAPRVRADLLEMTEESMREVLSVNLIGPFFLTQAVARDMETAKKGVIVNISSVSAEAVSLNRGEYCVSKAGVSMATQLYAARLAESGVRVYELRPGIIRTDMTSAVSEKYDQLIAGGLTPIARWGEPEDVAEAVAMLAEGRLPFSTGEVINIDGGLHIRRL